jgi:hypothetical protein
MAGIGMPDGRCLVLISRRPSLKLNVYPEAPFSLLDIALPIPYLCCYIDSANIKTIHTTTQPLHSTQPQRTQHSDSDAGAGCPMFMVQQVST